MKKYIWFLFGVLLVVGPGVYMYMNTGDISVECVIKEPGVVNDHETVNQYTIPHSQAISVSTSEEEDHSVVVYRNLKGTQFASYPGICRIVR